ncbi:hypothetical protein N7471_010428 [Penicillium samsonianum]|uniref:uncharacterized protein n=1 Tax=Penicillium samsonianum TaxID=1882272 RepID=UPI002549A4E1|nr:uncharacterized protein N7471_010428 [Penicillium samsonianum]KAJ6125935.1 hypothetical protein N7471_010428 [Penicillium samsonianum]
MVGMEPLHEQSLLKMLFGLEIDRGRLRGLKLDDESSQTVHRGFGLLWDFLETCGLKASYQNGVVSRCEEMDKENQLRWFQHRDIKASETEDMLQIWNVLKSLLLKHSAQRQIRKQGLEQHGGENVVVFMKCGLGEIQQYFTGTNDTGKPFWDGSSIDGFFGAACLEWQDK